MLYGFPGYSSIRCFTLLHNFSPIDYIMDIKKLRNQNTQSETIGS